MKRLYQAEEHKRKVVGEQLSNLLKELYLGHVHKAYYQKTHNGEVVTIIFCNTGFLDINVYPEHIPYIYGAVITFTAFAILWFALTYKDKLRAKRGYYERKERR